MTMIYIGVFVLLMLIAITAVSNIKTDSFKDGYNFAKDAFQENNFRSAVEYLEQRVEESNMFDCNDDFDKGITRCMNDSIGKQICILDDREGGDWYFDYEDYKFKDSLTSRQIIL